MEKQPGFQNFNKNLSPNLSVTPLKCNHLNGSCYFIVYRIFLCINQGVLPEGWPISVLWGTVVYLCPWFSLPFCIEQMTNQQIIEQPWDMLRKYGANIIRSHQLHLITALFSQCHEMKLALEVGRELSS